MEFTYNDGGRQAAGYKTVARGDCAPRAIAIALDLPYKKVLADLYELGGNGYGRSHPSQGTSTTIITRYLKSKGWKYVEVDQTLRFRRDNLPKRKRMIVAIQRHVVAVIDGVLHDTWESTKNGEALVLGYWVKGKA